MATYNGAATLPRVLHAYCELFPPPGGWSLVIVDNGSDDDTRAVIDGFAGRLPLRYLREERRGKNVALNAGLDALPAGGGDDLVVFSDDDAIPAPDWLQRLAACAVAHPEVAMFGGAIVPAWPRALPDWIARTVPLGLTYAVTDPALQEGPIFPGLIWGANMALRRALFMAGARFDDSIGPNGSAYAMGGETQLLRQLGDAGHRSWFCPQARVAHIIRPAQLTAAFILRRAHRFGRGKFRQDLPGQFPTLFNIPRWMWRRMLEEAAGLLQARLRRQPERAFLHRWELAYLSGYLYEAWRGKSRRGPASPQRVLISSYSGELGGMELRMGQEARVLAAAGYRALLATRRFPGFERWAAQLRGPTIDVSVFDPPLFFEQWAWRRWNRLRAASLGVVRLRRYRADLVHVAFCWNAYGASALWLTSRAGLPAVISVHNAFPDEAIPAWQQPLLRQAFQAVRGIYAVSDTALQHFQALYSAYIPAAARLAVIPNSVDLRRFAPSVPVREAARQRLGLPQDCLVIGSVARLSAQKRPHLVLQLFCALLPGFSGLRLVMIGGGPLEIDLRAQAEAAGVGHRIVFTGFSEAVETLLPALDLHLLLSRNEGFGIATIEAMACGVPAVGCDVPGTSDILGGSRGGILVPRDDMDTAARQVADLLADPARRRHMARHARAEAEEHYSDARLQRQVLAFYRGLL
jgi:glycosyltransferase involved in cell wall biosynthesis